MTDYEKIVETINNTSSDDEETLMEECANAQMDSLERDEFELSLQKQFYKRDNSNLTKGYKQASRIDIVRNRHVDFNINFDRTVEIEHKRQLKMRFQGLISQKKIPSIDNINSF